MTSNFKILSLFIDALSLDESIRFYQDKELIYQMYKDYKSKYIDIKKELCEILYFDGDSIIFDKLIFKKNIVVDFNQIKDDIKTMDDLEFTIKYGRDLTDDSLLMTFNEAFDSKMNVDNFLEAIPK